MTRAVAIALLAAALAVPAAAASAQLLPVRTGEHDGFTRIVIPIERDRDWSLQGEGVSRRLLLSPDAEGFDLSRSYDLIPRSRVAALEELPDGLEIRLGCDCGVTAFRYQERYLVIDVADAAPEARPDSARPVTAPVPEGRADATDRARTRAAAAALPNLARLLTGGSDAAPQRAPAAAAAAPPPATPADMPASAAAESQLEEAAHLMAEQLARAAAAGLLDTAPDQPLSSADPVPAVEPATPDPTAPDGEPAAPEESAALPAPPRPRPHPRAPRASTDDTASQRAQERDPMDDFAVAVRPDARADEAPPPAVRARTAFDIAARPGPDPDAGRERLACTGNAPGIAGWSAGGGVQAGLGPLRRAVFDARDRLIESAAIDLARHYLYYGFGAEAVFWLSQLEQPPADLLALGQLADGTDDPAFPAMRDPAACSDEEFLLRYLAGAVDAPPTRGEADRLQLAFSALPPPLRGRLGPGFARRLAGDGRREAAMNVRDILELSQHVPRDEILALDLDLGFAMPPQGTRAALDEALRDDGATPARTMTQALAFDRRENRRPDPQRLTAADALLRETPAGPESDRLWREIAVARAALGQVDTAIGMIEDGRDREPAVRQEAIGDLVANRLQAEDTAALALLAHLYGPVWTASGSGPGRVRVAAAEHLRRAGLVASAAAMETHGAGLALPRRSDPPAEAPAENAAWSAGAWAEAAELSTGVRAEIARRMAARSPEGSLGPSPPDLVAGAARAGAARAVDLDTLSARVADSRALREAVSAVLETPGAPAGRSGSQP